MEHHLGMTCAPVAGLGQVSYVERDGIGAGRAAAASLALRGGTTRSPWPRDNGIEAMRPTGIEMNHKFEETSLCGMAIDLPEC